MSEVFTLLLQVSKTEGDDLPEDASGAGFVLFAPAQDEAEAVREAVKLFRAAGLHPLEVVNYGTLPEREAEGYEFSEEEQDLAREALREDAVVIVQKQVFYGDEDEGLRN